MYDVVIDLGKENITVYQKDIIVLKEKRKVIIEEINTKEDYKIIKHLLHKVKIKSLFKNILILGVINDSNKVIKKLKQRGFKKINICDKNIVLALGMGIDITKSSVSMLIDIDNDNLNISLIALGKIIKNKTISLSKIETIKDFISKLRPEIITDISEKGIVLTGNISNVDKKIYKETNIIVLTNNDIDNVYKGSIELLKYEYLIKN